MAVVFGFGWYHMSQRFESVDLGPASDLVVFLRRIGVLPVGLLSCALSVPIISRIASMQEQGWKKIFIWQTSFTLIVSIAITFLFCHVTAPEFAQGQLFVYGAFVHLTLVLPAFLVAMAIINLFEFRNIVVERTLMAEKLKSQLATAQLESISARLQPHFLFNSLQCISTLLHRDPVAADKALNHLSVLLRRSLQGEQRFFVSLREEIDAIREYVAIYQLRFGDRLLFADNISDGVSDALVPSFCLQPIVENSIAFGLDASGDSNCRISVTARRDAKDLVLAINNESDTPLGSNNHKGHGLGLKLTRKRLQVHFESDYTLTLSQNEFSADVTLTLPFTQGGNDD